MKQVFSLVLILGIFSGFAFAKDTDSNRGPWSGMDQAEFSRALGDEGVEGWIHAANPSLNLYVFTLRNPENFFEYELYPLTSRQASILEQLPGLQRHDKVRVRGELLGNRAPQKHINLTELVMVEAYEGDSGHDFDRVALPEDFPEEGEMMAKVHAIADQGRILVLEKGPWLFPVFVNNAKDQERAATFFRGDKISINYVVRRYPGQPVHLSPQDEEGSLRLVDSVELGHGEPFSLTGTLVMYSKSPQILFNVFAIQDLDENDLERNYTLINFENPEAFKGIREKLQSAWDSAEHCAEAARNKWVNPAIQVTARGLKNVVSPNQANPQIVLESADDVEVVIRCN